MQSSKNKKLKKQEHLNYQSWGIILRIRSSPPRKMGARGNEWAEHCQSFKDPELASFMLANIGFFSFFEKKEHDHSIGLSFFLNKMKNYKPALSWNTEDWSFVIQNSIQKNAKMSFIVHNNQEGLMQWTHKIKELIQTASKYGNVQAWKNVDIDQWIWKEVVDVFLSQPQLFSWSQLHQSRWIKCLNLQENTRLLSSLTLNESEIFKESIQKDYMSWFQSIDPLSQQETLKKWQQSQGKADLISQKWTLQKMEAFKSDMESVLLEKTIKNEQASIRTKTKRL